MPLPALWLLVKRAIYHTISHAAVKLRTHCFLRSVTHFFSAPQNNSLNLEAERGWGVGGNQSNLADI